jgi:hypothetical protein
MHEEFIQKRREKLYVIWLSCFQPIVILSHPDAVKLVMRTNAPKTMLGPGYPFLIPWLGRYKDKVKNKKIPRCRKKSE